MTNKDYILEKLEKVSNLSESISDDVALGKRALSGLLTDKDRIALYYDFIALMDALEGIKDSADLIGYATEDARREFEKENHNTAK